MASMGIKKPAEGSYTFASEPRAVQTHRSKYRDPNAAPRAPTQPSNIMYDPRIVRGSTYATRHLPLSAQPDPIEIQRRQEARRRAIAKRRAEEQCRPRTPQPVAGRKHIDIQTELYLEELTDRVVEKENTTQTDLFLDRPPTPQFIPAKTGQDIATQIEEGELFDFDVEVKPILEVLVGKTMEQSLMEVMEEEELASLRDRQRAYEELRNAELAETQRLEEAERRRRDEKEKRLLQEKEVRQQEQEASKKVAARAFAQTYLSDIIPTLLDSLEVDGYFYDSVEREIETEFIPTLLNAVDQDMKKSALGRTLVDMLLADVVRTRERMYEMGSAPADPARVAGEEKEEAAAEEEAAPAAEEAEAAPTEGETATEGQGNGEEGEKPEGEEKPDAPAEAGEEAESAEPAPAETTPEATEEGQVAPAE